MQRQRRCHQILITNHFSLFLKLLNMLNIKYIFVNLGKITRPNWWNPKMANGKVRAGVKMNAE